MRMTKTQKLSKPKSVHDWYSSLKDEKFVPPKTHQEKKFIRHEYINNSGLTEIGGVGQSVSTTRAQYVVYYSASTQWLQMRE